MKKVIAIAVAVLCFATIASAQPKALGIRATYGAELSYQHNAGPGFFEFDAGLFDKFVDLTAIYDFKVSFSLPHGPERMSCTPASSDR